MLLFFSKQNGYCILTPSKGAIFCNISHVFIKKDLYFNGQQNNYTITGYLKINLPIKQMYKQNYRYLCIWFLSHFYFELRLNYFVCRTYQLRNSLCRVVARRSHLSDFFEWNILKIWDITRELSPLWSVFIKVID